MKVFPQKLEAVKGDVQRMESLLQKERVQLEETESWKRRQEQEMRDEESQLIKAKQRSQLVKNAKEHMANERELETTRKMTQEREAEVGRLTEAVETAKKTIAQHETDFGALKQHVADEEAAAAAKIAEIEAQIAEERKLREVAASRVDAGVLKKYSAIRMRRGLAMAPVKNGTCQGCNMNIPPQLFNILQRGNSIELCGNCNRIVYWDKLLEDPDGQPAEASPKQSA
jgi:predicted  nucleic acid-binding Zn-ribbon protein